MKIIRSIAEMQQIALSAKRDSQSIGFVPTMGYLHEGHQQLLRAGREENHILVMSIFVNPLQFGPNEDFDRYPRDEEHDFEVAKQEQVDYVFIPSVEEMYPTPMSLTLTMQKRVDVLCGRSREGHFDGVVTVLTKLFHIVLPERAYFGLKDAQQFAVVDALVQDFNFPIELRPISTVRETSGLAKSSRNVYLSSEEKEEAQYIYKALQQGQALIQNGQKTKSLIINEVIQFIKTHTRGKIDYVDLLTYPTLREIEEVNQRVIIAVAVYFEKARLIDNLILEENGELTYSS
ncbi:pantoate--beta-alanine ligase [Salinibacillus xinjiangensis]|uniref:Pantothenate synthetase n=1 Tax=Salinibacillus xinjiangensis TaxID=1229268 RepID=A0A6G1X610_9BACI|nr:pantoate--beta-alanine ligase [Salinibacillus xinjiangensis]MRG86377.1 pantoate--beta-alanine ligase [Salinibacillus xinjiangensis]